jgi:anti-sigma regulatory factor (Ser/Thr protein kinase)
MEQRDTLAAARGLTDEQDRLLSADTALALLQERCGGTLPGTLAIPELLEQVQHARQIGLRIARSFSAFDGDDMVSGFVRINPRGQDSGGGCELLVESWQRSPAVFASSHALAGYLDAIDRASAEVTARLDARQQLLTLGSVSRDASGFAEAANARPDSPWSDLVELQGMSHRQPLHWRLLDGAACHLPGSQRNWRARLIPVSPHGAGRDPLGFELLLIADEPLGNEGDGSAAHAGNGQKVSRLIGSALAPVLRQPVARIIANAETIRARLAGPLHHDYCHYAATIASAGQHLAAMLDDLADLEVVEAEGFATLSEEVDLVDVAHKAAGILGVRARERQIGLAVETTADQVTAQAEFRRVMQILLNLIGNAIAYSPEGSTVRIAVQDAADRCATITVSDEGPGVTPEQATRIFEKFERLGRDSNGGKDKGSGLGLYISRRLAEAMEGTLTVANGDTGGAVFRLELPKA